MESCGIAKHRALTDDTKLYRYIGLSQFLSHVENRRTYITKIRHWQDTWEMPDSQIPTEVGGELTYKKSTIAEDMFGQSWSLHSESDALWRVYSPRKEGVLIQTTVQKFDLMQDVRCGLLAPVIYYDHLSNALAELEYDDEYLPDEGPPWGDAFLKRKAFDYEAEVRFVTLNRETCLGKSYEDCTHISISLDPIEFIESITIDPRSADWYVATLQKYCARAGFRTVPMKSDLYSAGVFESTGLSYELAPLGKNRD